MKTYLFESIVKKIGNHEWRFVVYDETGDLFDGKRYGGGRFTDYEWRVPTHLASSQPNEWQNKKKWPRYNFNDGTYAGLPRSLATLYKRHSHLIKNYFKAAVA